MGKGKKTQLQKQSARVDRAFAKMDEEARQRKNAKARERHWRKTGVSDSTIRWMKDGGWL